MTQTKDGSQEPRGDKSIAEMTFNEVKEELSKYSSTAGSDYSGLDERQARMKLYTLRVIFNLNDEEDDEEEI